MTRSFSAAMAAAGAICRAMPKFISAMPEAKSESGPAVRPSCSMIAPRRGHAEAGKPPQKAGDDAEEDRMGGEHLREPAHRIRAGRRARRASSARAPIR